MRRIQKNWRDRREATRLKRLRRLQVSSRNGLTSWSKNKPVKMTSDQCLVSTRMIPLQSPTASSPATKSRVRSTGTSWESTWCLIEKSAESDRTRITSGVSSMTSRNGSLIWRPTSSHTSSTECRRRPGMEPMPSTRANKSINQLIPYSGWETIFHHWSSEHQMTS